MRSLIFTLILIITSCNKEKLLDFEPTNIELTGVYLGVNPENGKNSRLIINNDKIIGENVPERKGLIYTSKNFENALKVKFGGPGDEWYIGVGEIHLTLYEKDGIFVIKNHYDVSHPKSVVYRRE